VHPRTLAIVLALIITAPGCLSGGGGEEEPEPPEPPPEADHQIRVFADQGFGKIAPIHGVNNGPLVDTGWDLCQGLWYDADYSEQFNMTQIPSARTHGEGPGDMNRIWVHLDENGVPVYDGYDPLDPANYDFSETDDRINSTMGTTHTEVYWRLGYSKGAPAVQDCPDWRAPPDNLTVFAQAAVQVLKHYREGWADGYYYEGFNAVEVWNEPYLPDWYSGTPGQYFQMYHEVNTAVTAAFGNAIDVVAAIELDPTHIEFTTRFLELAREHEEPIDAVYVHLYRTNPSQTIYNMYADENYSIEALLTAYGYPADTPVYITEWNRNIPIYANSPASQPYLMSILSIYNDLWEGNEGNSSLGHTNLRMAHYFASRSFMWTADNTPKPPGFTWEIYGKMISDTPNRLATSGGHHSSGMASDELNVLAGVSDDGETIQVLITRYVADAGESPNGFSDVNETVDLYVDGLGWGSCTFTVEMSGLTPDGETPWQSSYSGTDQYDLELEGFVINERSYHLITLEKGPHC